MTHTRNLREAAQLALDAINAFADPEGRMPADTGGFNDLKDAGAALTTTLALPDAQPVTTRKQWLEIMRKRLPDAAPQPVIAPEPVLLAYEEIDDIWAACSDPSVDEIDMHNFARAIEAAHIAKQA